MRARDFGMERHFAVERYEPYEPREASDFPNDRPTIPAPPCRDSGVRFKISRVPLHAATIDIVLCDLSRDPRSEDWDGVARRATPRGWLGSPQDELEPPRPARHALLPPPSEPPGAAGDPFLQNERPPSTSIVRALK